MIWSLNHSCFYFKDIMIRFGTKECNPFPPYHTLWKPQPHSICCGNFKPIVMSPNITLLFGQPCLISSRPGFESIAINHGVDIEKNGCWHYSDVIISTMAYQITGCLLNRFFGRRSKKTSKLRVTGLCEGNPPVIGGFSSQRASNAETASIWWCHHVLYINFRRCKPLMNNELQYYF